MKLQFILGRPGTGKTTYCYSEIAAMQEEKDDDSALILIVPEQFSFQSEKALLAATPRGAISRARVLSFNRLFYFVLSKTGGLGRATLENSGKNMVLRKIVGGLDKQLGYYKSAKDAKGFLDSLSTSITEFYHYDITPDTLEQKIRAADGALALKLTDLHLIYSNYKNFLEENFISSDEVLDILAEKIPKADFLQNACIWIDGFKSFTPQEARVLAALLRMAKQVKIALPSPKRLADFSEISKGGVNQEVVETMEKIQQMVLEAGAAFDEPQVLTHQHRHKNAPDIAFLCQNFLSIRNVKFADVPQNIRIAPAENIFDEIDAAARLVTTLTRDRGYKYSEIGIIATNLAEYEKFVPAMFARYHIPVFVDARRGILSHPLVDLVFAACQVIYTNWNYESVFRMLRLPIFDCREEIDILENYVLAYNIRGKTTWQKDFAYGDEDELAALNPLRQRVYDVLAPLHEKFTPRRKYILKNFATAIYNFLIQIDAP
ncbi:MAG: hypothetical protein FWC67_04925, partial [Defluviitaleaceae bacterium]|nr:hypothetical protein [Defluviitaleaceae bacterium]